MNRLHFVFQAALRVSRPQPGCHYPNPSLAENNLSIADQGDGKIDNLFYSVCSVTVSASVIIASQLIAPFLVGVVQF
jgi:hypothetical protein